MSKIICDVCGTSYPETGTQCPICGCVRSSDAVTISGDTNEALVQAPTYTYVRGGRYSKTNVKKRNAGKPIYNAEPTQRTANNDKKNKTKNNGNNTKKKEIGLIATVVVLLIAIAVIVIYIACQFLNISLPMPNENEKPTLNTTVTTQQNEETTQPTTENVSCEDLTIMSDLLIELNSVGEKYLISVLVAPENTNDLVEFTSDNEQVAVVDSEGVITAVGNGEAVITVTCGELSETCYVECKFEDVDDPTEETETTAPEVAYTQDDLKFIDNGFGYEYTIALSEKSYQPYNGNIPAELVTFSSNDESVVTVSEDGLVTFVGRGRAIVTAKYAEFVIECIFRII